MAEMAKKSSRADLLEMLKALPPSQEILDFYHEKLEQFDLEEREWVQRLRSCRSLIGQKIELEDKVESKCEEIRALQKALVDVQTSLMQERKRTQKLQLAKDRTKLAEFENRRKILLLLEICGKTDNEVSHWIKAADEENEKAMDSRNLVIPNRIKNYLQVSKKHPSKINLRRSNEGLKLEILALENQLLEQEKCHIEQLSVLENERRLQARERDESRDQYEHRINELSQYVKTMELQQDQVTEELAEQKTKFRREERKWMAEKESLLRKLQFVQNFGPGIGPGSADGAFFTDQRAAFRQGKAGNDAKWQRQVQKLNSELSDAKSSADTYKSQLLALEVEMEALREQSSSNKDILKKRTKNMVEQVDTLKERYNNLEKRKKQEAEGYQQDIRILRQKVRQIEQQLIRAAVAKAKEHDYIKTLNAYEKELEEMRKYMKQHPHWIDP